MKIINNFLFESRQKYIVYQDLDGCLTNFEKAFEDLGYGSIEEVEKKRGPEYPWILIDKQGVDFWSEMEWMPDGKDLWNHVKKYTPIILSSPSNSRASREGKKIWVRKNLGSHVDLILAKRKEKQKYSRSGSILIDDMEKTIKEWNESGGIGILHKDTKSTIERLKGIFK